MLFRAIMIAVVATGAAVAWRLGSSGPSSEALSFLDPALRIFALSPERGSSIDRRGPPPGQMPTVSVARPAEADVIDWDEFTGRFEAAQAVDVRARVAGYLEQVHFKDGQTVAQGDLLYTIDRRPFEATVEQARAELGQARTRVENASKDVERGRPLVASRVMSDKVFDDRMNLKREAEAAVKVAEAKVRTAELDLSFTRVIAPIGGRISRAFITPGNFVTGGGSAQPTLLTTIVSQDPIHLYFDISEANAIKYRRLAISGTGGGAGEIGATVEFALPDEQGFPHRGMVDFSDNRLDAGTGTLRVRAVVENRKGLFSAGLFARVRVAGSPQYRALLLPDAALGTDQANRFVMVVSDDGSVLRRVVVPGPIVRGMRVIRSGLEPGDWVVTKGLQRARPGQKVKPTREVLQLTDARSGAAALRTVQPQ
jgi:RND family efflux transporter MFP subunit